MIVPFKKFYTVVLFATCTFYGNLQPQIIIDHTCTDITQIPQSAIEAAKADLHIAFAHSSHGRQPVEGMTFLVDFANANGLGLSHPPDIFEWSEGGVSGTLDLRDYDGVQQDPRTLIPGGAVDLGNPDGTQWALDTRTFLDDPIHSDINVIMWSWCGQLSGLWAHRYGWPGWETWDEENHCFHLFDGIPYDISTGSDLRLQLEDIGSFVGNYLLQMSELERDYPDITFIYMTGHLEGTGLDGILNKHNEIIREYCREYEKILYDFADIERYDPEVRDFMSQSCDDGCNYDANGNGITETNGASAALPINGDANWAIEWQNSHTQFNPNLDENADDVTDPQPQALWFYCTSAHTQPLNANLKAYAAWWLWAKLAGWSDHEGNIYVAQTAQGNDSGNDPANAHSIDWLNDENNWSSSIDADDGLIGPGDTVHLCGTISTAIMIRGSGMVHYPITIYFEENAKLSSPCFEANPGNHNDGAITLVQQEHVIIDGGENGLIENTDTGTITFFNYYRTNQDENNMDGTVGICISESQNIEIKNMHILNLYKSISTFLNPSFENRYGDIGAHTNSRGILIHQSDSIHVLNNEITYTGFGVIANVLENENIEIDHNVFSRCSAAIVGAGIVNHDNPSLDIHHNYIFDTTDWGYNDGMKFFGTNPDQLDRFKGIKIYNNIIGPDISTENHPATAWIVADQGFLIEPEIFHNVFIAGPNDYNTGRAIHFIEVGGNYHITNTICPQNSKIYNNTIFSESPNSAVGIVIGKGAAGHQIYNNIIKATHNITAIMIVDEYSSIDYCDYNNYYTSGALYFNGQSTLESWRTTYGFDMNSILTEPQFLNFNDPVGPDNSVFTTDDGFLPVSAFLEGSGRCGDDIGAYDYGLAALNQVRLQIKIFLEGPYVSQTMGTGLQTGGHIPLQSPYDETTVTSLPADIVDWVQVELRTQADGSGECYTKSGFVRSDGRVVDTDGSDIVSVQAPEGDYYIVIKHRNHLSVMSGEAVHLTSN